MLADRNTRFLVTTTFNQTSQLKTASFQSVKFRGRYLVMDEQKGRVLLRRPGRYEGRERFEVVTTRSPIHVTLRDRRGCFVGFDANGELLDPCTLKSYQHQTWLTLRLFEKKTS